MNTLNALQHSWAKACSAPVFPPFSFNPLVLYFISNVKCVYISTIHIILSYF